MAEKIIEKTYMNKQKEKVTTKYRVDADFIPTEPKDICQEFIIEYCEQKGESDWLYELFTRKVTKEDKDGNKKEVELSALEVRKEFIGKFFPNLSAKKKTATAKELFLQRYKSNKK